MPLRASAVRTFYARLQPVIAAIRTADQISLWPGKNVNQKSDHAGEHHQYHPQHRAIIPLALASRATQTKSAIFRTKMMTGIARNVLHMAQPATPEAASDDCASAGRAKTLNAAIDQRRPFDLICIPIVKSYHAGWRACNPVGYFLHRLKPVPPRNCQGGTHFSLCILTRLPVLREREGN